MKKLKIVLLAFIISAVSCFAFGGCNKVYEVSSLEDLYAMESNKNYILTCDLDLQNGQWYPLSVKGFNGAGHTIKNAFINENSENSNNGFFKSANYLYNVTFSNINVTINTKNNEYRSAYGIVVGKLSEAISNVSVVDSTATIILTGSSQLVNVGLIVGGCYYGNGSISVKNCKISNSSFTYVNNIGSKYCYTNFGGIIGGIKIDGNISESNIESCMVNNCSIKIDNISEYVTRVGGIIGFAENEKGKISNCASMGNVFDIKTEYGYNVGGLVGKSQSSIINCLSDGNSLQAKTNLDSASIFAGIGGLCGSNEVTIEKSVAQNNTIIGTSFTKSEGMYATGFVSSAEASIVGCAAFNNSITGGNKDAFTSKNKNLLFDCYIAKKENSCPNINELPCLEENEWDQILSTLSLSEDYWKFENGNLKLIISE